MQLRILEISFRSRKAVLHLQADRNAGILLGLYQQAVTRGGAMI